MRQTAAVTGANRGLGRGLVRGLLARGFKRVYALDIDPGAAEPLSTAEEASIIRLQCDVRSATQVAACARQCTDVDLLVNNAGINALQGLLAETAIETLQAEIAVNLFGTLNVCRAWIPLLENRPDPAILTIASALGRHPIPALGSYCISKAALASAMDILRSDLAPKGIKVFVALPGAIDTALLTSLSIQKMAVADAVEEILNGLAAGNNETLIGDDARSLAAQHQGPASHP